MKTAWLPTFTFNQRGIAHFLPIIVLAVLAVGIFSVASKIGNRQNLASKAADGSWHLIWSDEFNGSALDPTKWNIDNNQPGDACTWFTAANVSVANGIASLKVTNTGTTHPESRTFEGANIHSKYKMEYEYGRIEWRAKIAPGGPTEKGYWGGVWQFHDGWPVGDPWWGVNGNIGHEIDVAEVWDPSFVNQAIHWWYDPQLTNESNPKGHDVVYEYARTINPYDGFHIHAMEWTPTTVTYFIDGVQTAQHTRLIPDDPMYIIASAFVSDLNNDGCSHNTTATEYAGTVWGKTTDLDYVRLYKKDTTEPTLTTADTLILNGSFERLSPAWVRPWEFRSSNVSTITQDTVAAQGQYSAKVTVNQVPPNPWDAALYQVNVPVTAGKTIFITFRAKASTNRTIGYGLMNANSPFTGYGGGDVQLTNQWQQYTLRITPPETQANSQFYFTFGNATGDVWIDDVILRENHALNGSFESVGDNAQMPWEFRSGNIATMNHDGSNSSDGSYSTKVTVNQVGVNPWDVALYQFNVPIISGTQYRVSYRAKASNNRSMGTGIQKGSDPFNGYGYSEASLTPQWQQYSYIFTPNETTPNAQLFFMFANATGDVWVDSVSLTEGTASAPPPAPSSLPAPTGTPTPTAIPTPTPTATPTPTPTPTPAGDTQSPSVSITSPTNGATVKRNKDVTIQANATDNTGVTKVEFYVDGSLKCTDTVVPYTCKYRTAMLFTGTDQLQAKAYDAAGNVGQSSIVTVNIR